ncbi:MAG: tetratricopeptide repeat protein [Lewinellaceae bacterium]|nr:tetratricopeptide repeat protein [Saprospiraceae bacterium]MCB9341038.1 tetratricopeptide repeat protein [Lewinellaceae bacterium]
MKTIFIALFTLFLSAAHVAANTLDSLKTVLKTQAADTNKVKTLLDISSQLWRSAPDSAISYAGQASDLAEKTDYLSGKALALKNIGLAHYVKGDYLSVLNFWEQSLDAYRAINDKVGIGNLLSNIGAVYFNQGDDPKALEYYLESLRVSEETGNKLRIATALTNIGAVYFNKKATYDKAEEYYLRALEMSEAAENLDAIGVSSVNLGEIYLERGDHPAALRFFEKALEALKKTGGNESFVYTNIGKSYRMRGRYAEALEYQLQAFEKARAKDDKYEMSIALNAIGDTYFAQDNFKSALDNYLKAKDLGEEIGSKTLLKDTYENLAKCYSALSDFRNALQYQQLFGITKDSLYSEENYQKLTGLQFQFDIEKKETQIKLLNQENETKAAQIQQQKTLRNFLLAAAVFLIVTIGGVTYQYQFANKTNKIISAERNKSDKLLLNILPEETAEELKKYGAVKAKKYDFTTVLFTDFVAFTKHVENIPPEELVKSIDYYFKAFDAIFQKYNMEKIKTIGDSYMCVGGLPMPNETNPVDAILAGLDIVKFVDDLRSNKPDYVHQFEVRVGINTGPVIAGVVGTTKFQYDVWGDTVNVASRMETACEAGKVNVSEFTYQYVKDKFIFTHRGNVEVKNRGHINMYYVESSI